MENSDAEAEQPDDQRDEPPIIVIVTVRADLWIERRSE
jgi:hypothetical protein